MRAKWNKDLMCNVYAITHFGNTTVMNFQEGNCCDMRGAIKIAESQNPGVEVILTISGTKRDTVYLKQYGEWECYGVREVAA